MTTCPLPTLQTIHDTFMYEITQLGGCVTDDVCYHELMFLRSRLPHTEQVRPRDAVQGGVALRATQHEVCVHPYTFRKVCQNGAIRAVVTDTRRMLRVDSNASPEQVDEVLEDLRVAVQACGHKATLRDAVHAMRQASNVLLDQQTLIDILSALPRFDSLGADFMHTIMQRFVHDRDRTLFGLMNAVTSLARDTRDPETRWRLEELGGGVPALVRPTRSPGDALAVPLGDSPFATSDESQWPTGTPEDAATFAGETPERPPARDKFVLTR